LDRLTLWLFGLDRIELIVTTTKLNGAGVWVFGSGGLCFFCFSSSSSLHRASCFFFSPVNGEQRTTTQLCYLFASSIAHVHFVRILIPQRFDQRASQFTVQKQRPSRTSYVIATSILPQEHGSRNTTGNTQKITSSADSSNKDPFLSYYMYAGR